MKSFEVNHNLVAAIIPHHADWLVEMASFAAVELCRTRSLGKTVAAIRLEHVKALVVCDIFMERVLQGAISIPQYDPVAGQVEIAATALGGAGSFVFNGEEATYGTSDPVKDSRDLGICARLREIVARHDPKMGAKLPAIHPA